jgi:hypothetical protein
MLSYYRRSDQASCKIIIFKNQPAYLFYSFTSFSSQRFQVPRKNIAQQNSFGLRKRLYQKDSGIEEIFREMGEDEQFDPTVRSSFEIPILQRNNSSNKNNSPHNPYGRNPFKNKIAKSSGIHKIKKKRFQSAHVNNIKGIANLPKVLMNKSSEKDLLRVNDNQNEFFSKRKNRNQEGQTSKLKDILYKIQVKKKSITEIENKYNSNEGIGTSTNTSKRNTFNQFIVGKSANASPNTSKYTIKQKHKKYASRNEVSNIVKVTPPPNQNDRFDSEAARSKVSGQNKRKGKFKFFI